MPTFTPWVVVMPEPPEIWPTTLTDKASMVAEPPLTSAPESLESSYTLHWLSEMPLVPLEVTPPAAVC